MKLPSKVKINTYNYTIKEVENPSWNGGDAWGYCDYDNQEIVIKKNATEERKRYVVLHEILHAIFESVHASPASMRADEIEEYYVVHSAPMIVSLLRENPALLKYLTHKDK